MLILRLVAWKCRAAGVQTLNEAYDMTNAFASGTIADLNKKTEERIKRGLPEGSPELPSTVALFALRRGVQTMILRAPDGDAAFMAGTGGFMGDCNEPEIFMVKFYASVTDWNRRLYRKGIAEPFVARCLVIEAPQDLSMGAFVDDLIRTTLVEETSEAAVMRAHRVTQNQLESALEPAGYTQNRGKLHVLAAVKGRRFSKDIQKKP